MRDTEHHTEWRLTETTLGKGRDRLLHTGPSECVYVTLYCLSLGNATGLREHRYEETPGILAWIF